MKSTRTISNYTMFNSNIFSKLTDKFVQTSVMALVLAFGANIFTVSAQDDLRDSVYGNQKKTTDKSKSTKKKPKSGVVNNSNTANKTAANNKKAATKTFLDVVFVAKEPAVEVYLNDKNIGVTDASLKLSKKLKPGEYLLMAKNKEQILIPAKKITVNPEQTTFTLFDELPAKPTPEVVKPVEKEEKSDTEKALENSRKLKAILDNYSNPATTDAVTIEDWQTVFQTAQAGQLEGNTAIQLEANRWFATGQIELAKGEFTNALTAFNKAQEFMPNSALPSYALGNTYFASRKYTDALRLYQRALQIDPKLAMGYKKLGDTQRVLGKGKEAIAAYKNAIQYGYNTVETRLWLGTLMLETKQIEEAIKELEAVAKEMPKPEVFISIGDGYEKLKRDVSAIEAYQKAIDADPNSALAYFKLADVYQSQREYTKAKEAYEKAIALDPEGKTVNLPEAQKKLRETSNKINK